MASTTTLGTSYYPLSAYVAKDGALTLAPEFPEVEGAAASAAAPALGGNLGVLVGIGLTESKAKETLANEELSSTLLAIVEKAGGAAKVTKAMGNLFYDIAIKLRAKKDVSILSPYRDLLVDYIVSEKISAKLQLEEALKYLKNCRGDLTGLDEAAGVGIVTTASEITAAVQGVVSAKSAELQDKRYRFNTGSLFGQLRSVLKWADAKAVKEELETQITALLGPKTEADLAPAPKGKAKGKKEKGDAKSKAKAPTEGKPQEKEEGETFTSVVEKFHKVGKNDVTDGYVTTPNTKRLLEEHVKIVGGKVHSRFPPEPNGILHIGHAKAINFNFGFAKVTGGNCYLRYDDTNPEKEEKQFFDGILEDVTWLGHKPWKITHSSDYFDELHAAAVKLIHENKAFVCHQDISELRGHDDAARAFSPWRDRPKEESLRIFEDMRLGLVDEGKATLRIKHIMADGKVDPVAYRIKFTPHHRTKDTWCIYPTYVFTHCLCDSFENITHSLCTKEFQNQRPTYYWVCNALDRYCPVQWEYGRLGLSHTLVSKRKIGRLIDAGLVRGWDDPRLFTLPALRRRGFPAAAIHAFTSKVGVTEAQATLEPHLLESCVRDVLNTTAVRVMAVLDPVKVTVTNASSGADVSSLEVPNNPVDETMGVHSVPFSSVFYIDRCDFMEVPEKGFRRLSPKQPVGLKHASLVITLQDIVKDASGRVTELKVTSAPLAESTKPKAYIQWVCGSTVDSEPLRAQIRSYSPLFKSKNPEKADGGWIADANKDTLTIYDAFVDSTVVGATIGTVFQFERIGFFAVDKDTTDELMVFNLTVGLRG